jgi:glycosyltransferase involved in cell wall biosynthesis
VGDAAAPALPCGLQTFAAKLLTRSAADCRARQQQLSMHIAFAHDHAFYEDAREVVYSRGGQLGHGILSRYVEAFGHVTVLARSQPLGSSEHIEGMSEASGPAVSFRLLQEGRGGLQRALGFVGRRSTLARHLSGVDGLVARLPSVIGLEACRVAQGMGLPWAVEVVGSAWHGLATHGDFLAKAYAPVAHLQTRAAVRRARAVLYVTRFFLQRQYPTRARSVAVSDVELPDPDPATLAERVARIESRRRPLRIGLIGSVGPRYKGIDTCLEALARVRERLGAFEFHVLGPGDPNAYSRLARALGLERHVQFCGALPAGAAVRQWLDSVDIYVQPSRTEGLPRSLLEALSRGCPALGSRVGGIPELLESRCLHPPGDAEALGRLLLETAVPERMLELAQRNFCLASEFAATKLDRLRRDFWASFVDEVDGRRTEWLNPELGGGAAVRAAPAAPPPRTRRA